MARQGLRHRLIEGAGIFVLCLLVLIGLPAVAETLQTRALKAALEAQGARVGMISTEAGRVRLEALSWDGARGGRFSVRELLIEEPDAAAFERGSGLIAASLRASGVMLETRDGRRLTADGLSLADPRLGEARLRFTDMQAAHVTLSWTPGAPVKAAALDMERGALDLTRAFAPALLLPLDATAPGAVSASGLRIPAAAFGALEDGEEASLLATWLVALGYPVVTGAATLSVDPLGENGHEVALTAQGDAMGTVSVRAGLEDLGAEGWLPVSGARAWTLAPETRLTTFVLDYEDASAVPRLLSVLARQQQTDPDAVATRLALGAALLTAATGPDGAARLEPVSAAFSRFVQAPGRFFLSAEALAPVPAREAASLQVLTPEILRRLRLEARATPRADGPLSPPAE